MDDNPEENTDSEDSGSEVEVESDEEFQQNLEFAFGQVPVESDDDEDVLGRRKGGLCSIIYAQYGVLADTSP